MQLLAPVQIVFCFLILKLHMYEVKIVENGKSSQTGAGSIYPNHFIGDW
jgi:hypothetical protein